MCNKFTGRRLNINMMQATHGKDMGKHNGADFANVSLLILVMGKKSFQVYYTQEDILAFYKVNEDENGLKTHEFTVTGEYSGIFCVRRTTHIIMAGVPFTVKGFTFVFELFN